MAADPQEVLHAAQQLRLGPLARVAGVPRLGLHEALPVLGPDLGVRRSEYVANLADK